MRKLLIVLLAIMLSGCAGFVEFQNAPYLCSNQAEALYKELLKTRPYTDVRMAVGTWQRHPHQWVEIWENGKWWIEDPALSNFTNPEDYKTSHHLGWESIMQAEYPDVRR